MGKIAVLFAGQGAQQPGMGREFFDTLPQVKAMYEKAEVCRPGTINDCFESTQEALNITSTTQPCLYLTDLACYEALKERGIEADVFAGFSLGEIAALNASGILNDKDAFKLVCIRGEAMYQAGLDTAGGMLAILKQERSRVEELCRDFGVYPVNYNCPGQIAVSGEADRINVMKDALLAQNVRCMPIAVSGAFHTPYMESASLKVRETLGDMEVNPPKSPIYSNRTANVYDDKREAIIDNISAQVTSSVRFEDLLKQMYADGVDIFIECGPGKTLSGFVKRTLSDVTILNVNDCASLEATVLKVKELR